MARAFHILNLNTKESTCNYSKYKLKRKVKGKANKGFGLIIVTNLVLVLVLLLLQQRNVEAQPQKGWQKEEGSGFLV